MYFSKAAVLAVIASLPVVFGSPTLRARQNGVSCQTSSGSPITSDVTHVINEVRGRGGMCYQTNPDGSHCTTLVTQGEAAIAVCGDPDNDVDSDTSALSCGEVAAYANQVQQACMNGPPANIGTRVGGTYTISPSKRVIVIRD